VMKADSTQTLGRRVVERVARAEGVDPLDLNAPLYDAIDPDALETLFRPDGAPTGGRLAFEYCGHTVVVSGDGSVSLSAQSPDGDATRETVDSE